MAKGQPLTAEHKRKISEALKKHTGLDLDQTFDEYQKNHKGEIFSIAKKYIHYYDGPPTEMISSGLEHLYEKIALYDPNKAQFNTWAHKVLSNHFFWACRPSDLTASEYRFYVAIEETTKEFFKQHHRKPTVDELYKITKIKKQDIATLKDYKPQKQSLDAPKIGAESKLLGDDIAGVDSIDDEYERLEASQKINDALKTLDKKTALMVRMFYGLGDDHPYTTSEIGDKFKIGRMTVGRKIQEALLVLKKELQASGFEKSTSPLTDVERKNFDLYLTEKAIEQIDRTIKATDRFLLEDVVAEKLEIVKKAIMERLPMEKAAGGASVVNLPYLRVRQRKPQSMSNLRSVVLDKAEAIKMVIGNLQDGRLAAQSLLFNQNPRFGKVWTLPLAKSWVKNNKDKIRKIIDPKEL
jgi:RNA polymerase sigma factor (sigma-70 family)